MRLWRWFRRKGRCEVCGARTILLPNLGGDYTWVHENPAADWHRARVAP